MALTGSIIDWPLIIGVGIATFLGCTVVFVSLYLLRKKLNKATFALWRKPWLAWQARAIRKPPGKREKSRR